MADQQQPAPAQAGSNPLAVPAATGNKNIATAIPALSLPKGGGAIKSIEEKFAVNAATGSMNFAIPIPLTQGRNGFTPSLALTYDTGNGNSPFGLGWELGISAITRKTDKGLPKYRDAEDSDTFIIAGAEDLVPLLVQSGNSWIRYTRQQIDNDTSYTVVRYRPRIESAFTRIEKWTNNATGDTHWRGLSRDNIHSLYGLTPESRLADPADPHRVFAWLLCQTHDDKGSITLYRYKQEDFDNLPVKLSEKNRLHRCAQVYPKAILYGNKTAWYSGSPLPAEEDFLFRVVMDYGEHDDMAASAIDLYKGTRAWVSRKDAFSSCRAGFEVRTYRRCQRVLLFHCFEATELPRNPCLVKSLELIYDDSLLLQSNKQRIDGFSYLVKARQRSYRWKEETNSYTSQALPDFEFDYEPHAWDTRVIQATPDDMVHAPIGVDDQQYTWTDLYSEGIAGILTEQAGGWFYKANLGEGHFARASMVSPKPSFAGLAEGTLQVQELEGNGVKYLVQYDTEPRGFFKLSGDGEWQSFTAFANIPTADLAQSTKQFIDLDGNGRADLLVSDAHSLRWYPGAGEEGFELPHYIAKELDEEQGPLLLADETDHCIFLADMNGDGLTDIVRIRNGEVCYWPNRGYGKFGAKLQMAGAPVFDHPDLFNPSRLRLADIDGSGTTDIVYLGREGIQVWMNQHGNEWSATPQLIQGLPGFDNVSAISVCDLLGTGTCCIVYSSPLPQHNRQPLQYIDLMAGKKPHLLKSYRNNYGKEVKLTYASSTQFYLEDKKNDKPWITKLPFPVHVLIKKELIDTVARLRFATSYTYHHGYYDAVEKEFRGFGRVDQLDTETYEQFKRENETTIVQEELHQPPVLTKTWFHTGAYIDKEKITGYFRNPASGEFFVNQQLEEYLLPDAVLTDHTGAPLQNEAPAIYREAARACKSMLLRQEVYAPDGTDKAAFPYTVTENNCHIRMMQPATTNRPAVFMVTESESMQYSYEREPADPRITHSLILQRDEYGNSLQTASVVYGRSNADTSLPAEISAEQTTGHVLINECRYTNDINTAGDYRLRVMAESLTYETKGLLPDGRYYTVEGLNDQLSGMAVLSYHENVAAGQRAMRLMAQQRTLFARDATGSPLPLYQLHARGLVYEKYNLVFTGALLTRLYEDRVDAAMLQQGGYQSSAIKKAAGIFPATDPDTYWWIPSGTVSYPADPAPHFFMPDRYTDPFGNSTTVVYEPTYQLFIEQTENALQHKAAITHFDYRLMSPVELKDHNDNLTEVAFDTLGMVAGMAMKGKGEEADDLLVFTADLSTEQIDAFINDPVNTGAALLQHASIRFVYDLRQLPVVAASVTRDTHHAATITHGTAATLQYVFEYSGGLGQELLKKIQAEPGEASFIDTDNTKKTTSTDSRWVGNGRTIVNNKGNAIKQYEPYFSTTHHYEDDSRLVEIGVSPVLYYDPAGRLIRMYNADGSYSKTEIGCWQQKSFDENDTVTDSDWYAERTTGALSMNAAENNTARKTAVHADTPTIAVCDSLGRAVYTIAKNAFTDSVSNTIVQEELASFVRLDIAGNQQWVRDARNNTVMEYDCDMLGNAACTESADAGENRVFYDVAGKALLSWNSRQFRFRYEYDALQQPIRVFVQQGSNTEILAAKVIYGDSSPASRQQNFCGNMLEEYDDAGVVKNEAFDFKYNLLASSRQLLKNYKQTPDWNTIDLTDDLEAEVFNSSTVYNALNRPLQMTAPDNSTIYSLYNEAGLLDKMEVQIRNAAERKTLVKNISYNAKGQRESIVYGNDVTTRYTYDKNSFNLVRMQSAALSSSEPLQNIFYTFDPSGNIMEIEDKAQQSHFFNNAVINPVCRYTYDALYRLIEANGREHIGQQVMPSDNWNDTPRVNLPHKQDGNALREYIQQFAYDAAGNMLQLKHIANGGSYTRSYVYGDNNNRLKNTATGSTTYNYTHNEHGSFTAMPHLQQMDWNSKEELCRLDLGGGGEAWYVYNSSGQRIRKIVERNGGNKQETIYLGATEIYRETNSAGAVQVQRETLHLMDNTRRIALIETRVVDVNDSEGLHQSLTRYQFSNHLGSCCLELDDTAQLLSYEEYHPFGTSAYQVINKATKAAQKRYRYTGKERDGESGLYYHGARYYCCWLGRWTAADPIGVGDGLNIYCYVQNNPIVLHDPNGTKGTPKVDPKDPRFIEYNKNLARARARGFTPASPGGSRIHSYRVKGSGKGTGGGGDKKPTPPPPPGGQPGGKKGGDPNGSGDKDQAGDPNGNANTNQAGTGTAETPPANPQDNTKGGTEPKPDDDKEKPSQALHDLLMFAAVANNFSMPEDSKEGTADGIPEGRGSFGSKLGQALFVALAVVNVAQIVKAVYSVVKAIGSTIANKIAFNKLMTQTLKELTEAEMAQAAKVTAEEVPIALAKGTFTKAGDEAGINMLNTTPKAGRFDYGIHGEPGGFWIQNQKGEWLKVSPERVAEFMRIDGYKGGPVRLLSCQAGACVPAPRMNPAQRLANALNEPVLAPTEKVWVYPNGRIVLGPHYTTPSGGWVWFKPQPK